MQYLINSFKLIDRCMIPSQVPEALDILRLLQIHSRDSVPVVLSYHCQQ